MDKVDMLSTYCRKAALPVVLREEPTAALKPEVNQLISAIRGGTYAHSLILMSGLKRGKTTNAGALLKEWLVSRSDVVDSRCPGYFCSVHQLCYQNRTVDRYNRDDALIQTIQTMLTTDFLVLDGLFSYITQNDDLLLQSIYDGRQHSSKTTIVTTDIVDPTACAGSVLFRIARDAQIKVVF
jgi:hypothetical protein